MAFELNCPIPLRHDTIQMAHGGGGRIMRELLEQVMLPAFRNEALDGRHDSAVVTLNGSRIAFTTDTYVVHPRCFPGGDIGKLAVYGTVNDLAVSGATPLYLTCAMVLEEGLPVEELQRIIASMQAAAAECGVTIVTGDTKVVDRGKGDGIFINTAGIGLVPEGVQIGPRAVEAGDAVLVSGDLGRHGIAVMSVREGLDFETPILSDCASVLPLAQALLGGGIRVHCMRDPTRGGVASVLNEIALDGGVGIEIQESAIPVLPGVNGACEMLGLDPLYVACEGRMVAFVPGEEAEQALALLRAAKGGEGARIIGRVTAEGKGTVLVQTVLGTRRILDLLSGEQLPRIC